MSNLIVKRSDLVRRLTAQTDICGQDAFIDRIQLDIGDWAYFGTTDQICSAWSDFRNVTIADAHGEVVSLFNTHLIESLWNVAGLRFSSNPHTDPLNRSSALVSGEVELASWRFRQSGQLPGEVARLVFKTQLNLTRFLQAQQLKRVTRLDRPALASDYIMAITPEDSWYSQELPLLPATNIIIGPDKKYAFALKQPRTAQLRTYLRLVEDLISEAVNYALDGSGATATRLPYFSLKEIEFYWEFDFDDPINFVLSLREIASQHGQDFSEDSYHIPSVALRTKNQSPCLTIRLTQNIKIKIYAKTTRRVRFEVTLGGDAINSIAGPRSQLSIDGIVSLITPLAEEAAQRLRPLIQAATASPTPRGHATSVQLLHLITQAAIEPYTAEAIVAGLTAFGRVVPYSNDPLLRSVHRLRDRGVLRTLRPKSRIYVVTDEYLYALSRLQQIL
jgi:hypothetical protein